MILRRLLISAALVGSCVLLLGPATHAAPAPACKFRDGGALPDPACTPGAVDPTVTQQTIQTTICRPGWASTRRPSVDITEPMKFASMRAYGVATTPGHAELYELDHLIPIEVGGSSVAANLWPEAHTVTYRGKPLGSFVKDVVENRLKREVCAGTVPLAFAQTEIAQNWTHVP